jgi:hypothetical protein
VLGGELVADDVPGGSVSVESDVGVSLVEVSVERGGDVLEELVCDSVVDVALSVEVPSGVSFGEKHPVRSADETSALSVRVGMALFYIAA